MSNTTKILLSVVVGLVAVTQLYRSGAHAPADDAYFRILAATLDPELVPTNNVRTESSSRYCSGPRNQLVSSSEIDVAAANFKTMESFFKFDALTVISLITTNRISELTTAAQPAITGIAVYVVPFAIGFILSLVLWMFLCCCCTCPDCCPSKCCQHEDNILYTKCQLLWPSIFLIATLLLGAAACVPGITRASLLGDSLKTVQCGVSITLDDILNGNITSDSTKFFIGLNTLSTKMGELRGNITNIVGSLTGTVLTGADDVVSTSVSSKTALQTVASTTTNTSYSLEYTTPVTGVSTVRTRLHGLLGNPDQYGSKIQQIYNTFEDFRSAFSDLSSHINLVNGAVGTIQSGIDGVVTSVSDISTSITDVDTQVGNLGGSGQLYLSYVEYGFLGFYGAGIGIAVLGLLGVVLMACFDKTGCRHLMYFTCIIMFILCLVGFLLSFIMSLLIPTLYLLCTTINTATASSASLLNFTASVNFDANISSAISVCLPGGNGSIIGQFDTNGQLSGQLDSITNALNIMNSYRVYSLAGLHTDLGLAQEYIDGCLTSDINDLGEDPTSLTWFKELANRTKFSTACAGAGSYDTDSIVPSFGTKSLTEVPCFGSTTQQANSDLTTSPAGCLSLYNIFQNNGGNLGTALTGRYSAGCSAAMLPQLTQLLNNWHTPRTDPTTGIPPIASRYSTAQSGPIAHLISNLTFLIAQIDSAYLALNSTVGTLIDPTYGLLQGINCLLMGEDIIRMKDTLCVTLFNSFYFLFTSIGIASFAFLFSMCCTVCSGVRHYKQSQRKNFKAIGGESSVGIYSSSRNKL